MSPRILLSRSSLTLRVGVQLTLTRSVSEGGGVGPVGSLVPKEDPSMSTASTATRLTGRHLIAGRWPPASGGQFESHNPAHWDEVIGVFPNAGPKEAEQAVMAAREAYPGWRRTSRIRRAELFDNLAQIVKREQHRLAESKSSACASYCRASDAESMQTSLTHM